MGYRLKRLDESIFMAGPKPMQTEFGIRQYKREAIAIATLSKLKTNLPNDLYKFQVSFPFLWIRTNQDKP